MRKIDFKEKALLVYSKILEVLLIIGFALALLFSIVIEFFRQFDFKNLAKSFYNKPFSYLPKFNLPKKK